MTIIMFTDSTKTQTVAILTDVQVAHPAIKCPFSATLTPSSNYLSFISDTKTLNAQSSGISLPSDIGTNSFTLNVISANYPASVLAQTYTFNVIILCTV